jgi:hypothetical protein
MGMAHGCVYRAWSHHHTRKRVCACVSSFVPNDTSSSPDQCPFTRLTRLATLREPLPSHTSTPSNPKSDACCAQSRGQRRANARPQHLLQRPRMLKPHSTPARKVTIPKQRHRQRPAPKRQTPHRQRCPSLRVMHPCQSRWRDAQG